MCGIFRVGRRVPWGRTVDYKDIKQNRTIKPIVIGRLREDARNHEELGRDFVVECLVHFHAMGVHRIIQPDDHPITTIRGARRQAVHSTGPNQAAHVLPGQILINGKEPSSLLLLKKPGEVESVMIAARLNGLFGRTEDLHKNFNEVDTLVERFGNTQAFRRAAEFVLKEGMRCRSSSISFEAIEEGYRIYHTYMRDPGRAIKSIRIGISAPLKRAR